VLNDQESYYLIGFIPEEATFKREKARGFHDLKVKVNRPGVRVRTRSGFFGVTDEEDKKDFQPELASSTHVAIQFWPGRVTVGLQC